MPDRKISDLAAKTILATGDLLAVVDISAGPQATKKVTFANLKSSLSPGDATVEGSLEVGGDLEVFGNVLLGSGSNSQVDVAGDLNVDGDLTVAGDLDILGGINSVAQSGFIFMSAGSSIPSGYLSCDGTSYLRSTYPNLFSAISTVYGAVDGTHFNVPDMRGLFPRAAGTNATRLMADTNPYAGGSVGNYNADKTLEHKHGVSDPGHVHIVNRQVSPNDGSDNTSAAGANGIAAPNMNTNSNVTGLTVQSMSAGSGVSLRSATETAPASLSFQFLIKI